MLITLKKVFTKSSYLVVAIIVTLIVFFTLTLLPNLELIGRIAVSQTTTLVDFLALVTGIMISSVVSFSILSIFYTSSISLLFGINIVMFAYYIKMTKKLPQTKETVASIGGMTGGVLGVGCVACGSLALSPILSLLGVSATVAFLPFADSFFGVLSIVALLFSIVVVSRRIQKGNVC